MSRAAARIIGSARDAHIDLAEITEHELMRIGSKSRHLTIAESMTNRVKLVEADRKAAKELRAERDAWLADKSSTFCRIVPNRLLKHGGV